MIKKKITLFASVLLACGSVTCLAGCASSYDETLTIYNWEDYIYEGTDDEGNQVEDGTIKAFEKYYLEKTGKKLHVDYQTFSTNEDMKKQIELGAVKADLICPSDYMIQKMANDGLLEPFSYDQKTDKYQESLSNWDQYGSPFIRERFANEKLKDGSSFLTYAVPYFWGTMGFTYDPTYFSAEEVGTWEALWNTDAKYAKQFSLKDSMRDTYVTAIFHVYKDEIAALDDTAADFTEKLSSIFNRCDDETIAKVETALKATAKNVYGFEVDEGKDEIVKGTYHANLAWSGDAVFAMDNAEESKKTLCYALPSEGSNVWFDGWCMPKGAQKELAEEFVNFICAPENAVLNMEAVGYTSPIVGTDIWEYVNDTFAAEETETDTYTVDLGFYFGQSIEGEATIDIPTSEKGRQFDAQYPDEASLKRCCMMKDFGSQQAKVEQMWQRIK